VPEVAHHVLFWHVHGHPISIVERDASVYNVALLHDPARLVPCARSQNRAGSMTPMTAVSDSIVPLGDEDLRALLDAAPDATIVVRNDGVIEHANQRCEMLLGYRCEELIGKSVEVLIPMALRAAHVGHRERFNVSPNARSMGEGLELSALRKDGTAIPVEISLSSVHTSRRTWVCAAIRDMTWRRSREVELEAAKRSADQANAAKSEFLASMSHELRTPLNAILGFAQLLQRDKKAPLSERQRGWVEHVLRGGQHLLRLIDDVLDLARIESSRLTLSPEPVAVDMLVEEVITTLTPIADRTGIEIGTSMISSDLPPAQADRTRLSQILLNYGSNAIKYGRAGGRMTFTSYATHNRVRITVSDTGVGIPEEKQALLFQPFQRAGQETGTIEGTGIGLAICKRLAEAMHGTVGFRSAPGQGSEFWVELPTAKSPPARPHRIVNGDDTSQLAPLQAGPTHTVLYIEDNPANLAFMVAYFAAHEHVQLLTAPSGELGLELAVANLPDLILLDIHLPGIDGLEVLRRLRAQPETARIRVVAVSAVASKPTSAGFDRYLTKPLQVSVLDAMIAEYLPITP
jgi:PAS domain S-box-containing protein